MSSQPPLQVEHQKLSAWVTEHGQAVRSFLAGAVRHRDLADELFQEVFRRAWQGRQQFQERGTTRGYLLTIADRLVRDHHRRKLPERQLGEEDWNRLQPVDGQGEPPAILMEGESHQRLHWALSQLNDVQRRALLMRFWSQMSFKEIAEAMDCPLNTVLSHCRRGLLRLKQMIDENSE